MIPQLPDHCPRGADGSKCQVQRHSFRLRKAGPGFRLVVVCCTQHCRFFTLYPLGFVPFSRSRIAPVGEDGRILPQTDPATLDWNGTLFAPVAEVESLPSTNLGLEPGTRQQRRKLNVAAAILGLSGDVRSAELSAVDLNIELRVLLTARDAYGQARGVQQRTRAIWPVLMALPRSGPLLLCLLRAGTRAKVWGGAWWWTPGSGYVRSFQGWERR